MAWGLDRELSGATAVVGVIGDPIAHTLSPPMHNAAFRRLGIDWVYVPFHVKAPYVGDAVRSVRALSLRGLNVTVPHKVAVMEFLDEVDPEAATIGAVNTIVPREGRLIGYNTDGRGFLRSMERQAGRTVHGADVVIIGAGGSAKAIACSTGLNGARRITIANRTREKAESLARLVAEKTGAATRAAGLAELSHALAEADIVVHTTSVGMHPHADVEPVIDVSLLGPRTLVCDIVYRPRETSLIKAAKRRGCPVLTGEGMLAYQGAIALELWTGLEAPDDLMLETLIEQLR